jgi:hypothetical protein
MIATTQIIKTAQTNAAFHHGSTVPYGMAAIISRLMRVPNISFFSKANPR